MKKLSAAEFVRIWNKASSAEVAAKVMGRPLGSVQQRAYQLRKNGLELKRYRPGTPNDWNALKLLAKKTLPSDGAIYFYDRQRRAAQQSFYREFIIIFQRAKTFDEVTRRFNMQTRQASQLAARLRSFGVPLKRFRPRHSYNWSELRHEAIRVLKEIRDQKIEKIVRYGTRHKKMPGGKR